MLYFNNAMGSHISYIPEIMITCDKVILPVCDQCPQLGPESEIELKPRVEQTQHSITALRYESSLRTLSQQNLETRDTAFSFSLSA